MTFKTVQFQEVAEIVTGNTPSTKSPEYYGGKTPFVAPGDLGDNRTINYSENYLSDPGKGQGRVIPKNAVMICCIGATIGKVGISGIEMVTNQQINSLIFNPDRVDFMFGYYYCTTLKPILKARSHSTTLPIISKGKLSKFTIPLPPLLIQKKIAAVLDAADAYRQKTKALIEKYDELTQSLFLEMFGDISQEIKFPISTVGDLTLKVKDGPHVSPKYSDQGIPILSTRNIRPFQLVLNDTKFVNDETFLELTRRFKPQRDDILLTKGGTTGYAKHVDWDWEFCIWVHLAALRPNVDIVVPKYLEAALNTHYCYRQSQRFTRGIANKDLGLTRMIKIKLPLPPLDLQRQFEQRVNTIEDQKKRAKQSLMKAEELFQSLLQRAFKGELIN